MDVRQEELGSLGPRDVGSGEINWVRGLLRSTRNVTLLTEGPNPAGIVKAHGTLIYSAFTRLLSGRLQVVWRSRENRKHSVNIERECRIAAAAGERAVADVGFLLYDSSSRNPALEARGLARKIEDPREASIAVAIINGKRRMRGDQPPFTLHPDNSYALPYAMYAADIYEATIPAAVELTLSDGSVFPIDDDHAPLDLSLLHNFELEVAEALSAHAIVEPC